MDIKLKPLSAIEWDVERGDIDFYPAPPVITKRPGESKNDYRARWMRERSGNKPE